LSRGAPIVSMCPRSQSRAGRLRPAPPPV